MEKEIAYKMRILQKMRDDWEKHRLTPSTRMLRIVKGLRCDQSCVHFLKEVLLIGRLSDWDAVVAVDLLCENGGRASEYVKLFPEKGHMLLKNELMLLASEQDDPETVVNLVEPDLSNFNYAANVLCHMGREEYLVPFLIGGDESKIELVKILMDKEKRNA